MSALAQSAPDVLVTTHLHMTSPAQFRPAFVDDHRATIRRMERPDAAFYRFLYGEVGREWRWRDRLLMSDNDLYRVLSQPAVAVFVLYVDGVPAGYVELDKQGEETEIAYFGLRDGYMGSGYGKHLLSCGIAQAWVTDARRVWVHTCNLDSPRALNNYVKRGFRVFHVDKKPMPSRYV